MREVKASPDLQRKPYAVCPASSGRSCRPTGVNVFRIFASLQTSVSPVGSVELSELVFLFATTRSVLSMTLPTMVT